MLNPSEEALQCVVHSETYFVETPTDPLVYVSRCFGMLLSPGRDLENSQMNLLDNMVRSLLILCTIYMYVWTD